MVSRLFIYLFLQSKPGQENPDRASVQLSIWALNLFLTKLSVYFRLVQNNSIGWYKTNLVRLLKTAVCRSGVYPEFWVWIFSILFANNCLLYILQVGTKQIYWLVQNKPIQITENGSLQKWRLPRILGLDILNIIC